MLRFMKNCKHEDFPKNRIHGMTAYVFECPRCAKKIMYCRITERKFGISEKEFKDFTEFVQKGMKRWEN